MKSTLKERIKNKIRRSKGSVFMLDDFKRLSGADQVRRVLRQLIVEGVVVRVGKGVYVRAMRSFIDGSAIPDTTLRDIATVVIERQGGEVRYTPEQLAYNERRSTQVPNMDFVGTNIRISRKLTIGKRSVKYVMIK